MEPITFELSSPEITDIFGHHLGELVEPGEVICLDGDLGAGKTTLTQSIARGIGVPSEFYVTSPSFNIFHEYPGRLPLYHMDFYRLDNSEDVIDMGLDEYLYGSGVVIIEWSSKASDIIPNDSLFIFLQVRGELSRKITLTTQSPAWHEKINSLKTKMKEIS